MCPRASRSSGLLVVRDGTTTCRGSASARRYGGFCALRLGKVCRRLLRVGLRTLPSMTLLPRAARLEELRDPRPLPTVRARMDLYAVVSLDFVGPCKSDLQAENVPL